MAKNVIVVGMARSGTSLSASIFVNKGYFVADDPKNQLQKAGVHNPSGYWESNELVNANVEILGAVGFKHHNTWMFDEIESHQANALLSMEYLEKHRNLVERFNRNQPWIWKDPRLCYTLGYWWPLMNAETTSVLLVTRDPQHIWNSIVRTEWLDRSSQTREDYFGRIQNHLDFARGTIERLNIPHVEIDYSDYASKAQSVLRKFEDHLDVKLAVQDLGYKPKYDHATLRGYAGFAVREFAAAVPGPVRRLLKSLMPGAGKR